MSSQVAPLPRARRFAASKPVIRASEWRSGVIVAPCGAGKTQMGVALHRFAMTERPTLVLVHTRDLATQWDQRVRRLLGTAPVSPSATPRLPVSASAATQAP